MDARRLAYLDAMGIDVWQPRRSRPRDEGVEAAQPGLVLGNGEGDILCIARTGEEAGLRLAADISRAMRTPPVWAWPDGGVEQVGETVTLEACLAERLVTRVVIFGSELAGVLFGQEVPQVIAAARIHVVPGLDRLGRDREAKQILWNLMREQGLAARKAGGTS